MPQPSREETCKSASAKLAAAEKAGMAKVKATIGLDGFVDEIIAVVDKRQDSSNFTVVKNITHMAGKISAAANQSSNYEMVVKAMKLGGNGPIMANALACAGFGVTYIGNLGFPLVHPVFESFAQRAEVITIAEPGHTDALEFEDGKLMFGKHASLGDVNWQNLLLRVGLEKLTKLLDDSKLIGMVNWTMLPHLSDIWIKLLENVVPKLSKGDRKFFVDLADPEKRTHEDIAAALQTLTKIQEKMDVVLGLNLKESSEILAVLGLPAPSNAEAAIEQTAIAIREKLKLSTVVVHPRKGAAASTSDGKSAVFWGPFVKEPKISTGAGDHFNAGFCLGRVLGLTLEESLCTGVGTSGYYVRTAESPTAKQLADFIAELPPPQA